MPSVAQEPSDLKRWGQRTESTAPPKRRSEPAARRGAVQRTEHRKMCMAPNADVIRGGRGRRKTRVGTTDGGRGRWRWGPPRPLKSPRFPADRRPFAQSCNRQEQGSNVKRQYDAGAPFRGKSGRGVPHFAAVQTHTDPVGRGAGRLCFDGEVRVRFGPWPRWGAWIWGSRGAGRRLEWRVCRFIRCVVDAGRCHREGKDRSRGRWRSRGYARCNEPIRYGDGRG